MSKNSILNSMLEGTSFTDVNTTELVKRYNETKDEFAFAEVFRRLQKSISYFKAKHIKLLTTEELDEIAYDAMIKCLKHFDIEQTKMKFETYFVGLMSRNLAYERRKYIPVKPSSKNKGLNINAGFENYEVSEYNANLKQCSGNQRAIFNKSLSNIDGETKDLLFLTTADEHSSDPYERIELLSMFSDRTRKIVEYIIEHDTKPRKSELLEIARKYNLKSIRGENKTESQNLNALLKEIEVTYMNSLQM